MAELSSAHHVLTGRRMHEVVVRRDKKSGPLNCNQAGSKERKLEGSRGEGWRSKGDRSGECWGGEGESGCFPGKHGPLLRQPLTTHVALLGASTGKKRAQGGCQPGPSERGWPPGTGWDSAVTQLTIQAGQQSSHMLNSCSALLTGTLHFMLQTPRESSISYCHGNKTPMKLYFSLVLLLTGPFVICWCAVAALNT